jgi:hypothetical protein
VTVQASATDPLEVIFSGLLSWSSREHQDIFDVIIRFAELDLVIDLVSEIRLPKRKGRKVDLAVTLDSAILLDLTGATAP